MKRGEPSGGDPSLMGPTGGINDPSLMGPLCVIDYPSLMGPFGGVGGGLQSQMVFLMFCWIFLHPVKKGFNIFCP